jgi:hypothetical protein
MFYNFFFIFAFKDIGGTLGTHSSEGMEFGFDTTSLKIVSGIDGFRAQDADSLAIYLRASVSSSNSETSYQIIPTVNSSINLILFRMKEDFLLFLVVMQLEGFSRSASPTQIPPRKHMTQHSLVHPMVN